MYAKAKTVKTIMTFFLERFSSFRIKGHSMINFEPERWTKYADEFKTILAIKDGEGRKALDLVPTNGTFLEGTGTSGVPNHKKPFLETALEIETRLKVSLVKGLPSLKMKKYDSDEDDVRSTDVNRNYAG